MYRLLLLNFVDSFIDNCILSCVDEPAYGGIVQCELLFGLAAHSGIYVGNGDIVHLDGDGTVIKSKAKGFLDRLDGWNSAISVYTDCMYLTPQVVRGPLNGQRRQWVSAILIACSTLTATGSLPAALPAIRALISGLPDTSILFRKGTDGAYGNDESQPLQATCHRTGRTAYPTDHGPVLRSDNICSLHHPAV